MPDTPAEKDSNMSTRSPHVAMALVVSLIAAAGSASAAGLEHVMNIGLEGVAEGQFKYVEDFAFTKDGHLLVTDASA
jgi:hypothetical protein